MWIGRLRSAIRRNNTAETKRSPVDSAPKPRQGSTRQSRKVSKVDSESKAQPKGPQQSAQCMELDLAWKTWSVQDKAKEVKIRETSVLACNDKKWKLSASGSFVCFDDWASEAAKAFSLAHKCRGASNRHIMLWSDSAVRSKQNPWWWDEDAKDGGGGGDSSLGEDVQDDGTLLENAEATECNCSGCSRLLDQSGDLQIAPGHLRNFLNFHCFECCCQWCVCDKRRQSGPQYYEDHVTTCHWDNSHWSMCPGCQRALNFGGRKYTGVSNVRVQLNVQEYQRQLAENDAKHPQADPTQVVQLVHEQDILLAQTGK
jgi:hypothetical protein